MREGIAKRRPPLKALLLGIFILVSLGFGLFALSRGWIQPAMIQETVRAAGTWGMVVYIVGVVVLELLWIPRAWGLVAGGMLFGPVVGGLLSIVADMIGAFLCYLLARSGGRDWVEAMVNRHPRAKRVVDLLARRRGGVTIAALRVMPVAHYTLVSYAAGLTGVRLLQFLVGNAVGLIPGAVIYPVVGNAALDPTSPTFLIGISILIVGFLASAWWARRFLQKNQ